MEVGGPIHFAVPSFRKQAHRYKLNRNICDTSAQYKDGSGIIYCRRENLCLSASQLDRFLRMRCVSLFLSRPPMLLHKLVF